MYCNICIYIYIILYYIILYYTILYYSVLDVALDKQSRVAARQLDFGREPCLSVRRSVMG